MREREIIEFKTINNETYVITDYREMEQFKSALPISCDSSNRIKLKGKWFNMRHVVWYEIISMEVEKNNRLGRPPEF
jgi:hypothetical protein